MSLMAISFSSWIGMVLHRSCTRQDGVMPDRQREISSMGGDTSNSCMYTCRLDNHLHRPHHIAMPPSLTTTPRKSGYPAHSPALHRGVPRLQRLPERIHLSRFPRCSGRTENMHAPARWEYVTMLTVQEQQICNNMSSE